MCLGSGSVLPITTRRMPAARMASVQGGVLPWWAGLHQQLIDAGILVKKLDGGHPALSDCLRINVSSNEDNERLLQTMQSILG